MSDALYAVIEYLKYCLTSYEPVKSKVLNKADCGIMVVCDTLPSFKVHRHLGFYLLKNKNPNQMTPSRLKPLSELDIKQDPELNSIDDLKTKELVLSDSSMRASDVLKTIGVLPEYTESLIRSIVFPCKLSKSIVQIECLWENMYCDKVKEISSSSERVEEGSPWAKYFYFDGVGTRDPKSPNPSYVGLPAFWSHLRVWYPLLEEGKNKVPSEFIDSYEIDYSIPERKKSFEQLSVDIKIDVDCLGVSEGCIPVE